MAPIGERTGRGSLLDETNDDDEGQNLWSTILSEVQTSTAAKLPSGKCLLVLGDNDSGKTSLTAQLQGTEDPKKGSGLEYHFIDIKDEYRDDQTKLGVWILDGDPHHTGLLRFALPGDQFADTLVLLVVSMAQPWAIMETLHKWVGVLSDHIDRLRLPHEHMREFEESLVRQFQEYVEPEENQSTSSAPRRTGTNPLHPKATGKEEENVLLPLGETTLTNNLGIPIVVVVTKSDAISTLEKEHDYREEHFDFIQQDIRKFCLNYGAALFYTSVKEKKNCDLLYKYIVNRIYGFPFFTPALVVDRDAVFIPAGWDGEKKISILYENMASMKADDLYEDIIAKPVMRKPIQRDAEVMAEDEQGFLLKQQAQLSKQPAPGAGRQESPLKPSGGVQKPSTSPRMASPGTGSALAGSPKKIDAAKAGASPSEGVLANFFNSLLSKKTGAGGPSPGTPGTKPGPDRAAVTRDAAAELDRMTRAKKPIQNQTSNSTAS